MKKIFVAAVLALGFGSALEAQTVISNEKMTHDEVNVTVSFDVDTDAKGLPSRRKEVITPYIYNQKDTLFFDSIEVYGKGRFKRERQVNAINGDKDWELGEHQTLKGTIYQYTAQVPLKRWMTSANLGIKRQLVGCACEKDGSDENLAEGIALFEEPTVARRLPQFTLADVENEWDFGQDELEIVFKVSKIEIDSTVFDNEVTFGKILGALDKIYQSQSYKLTKLHVAGYASPEGSQRFNTWLGINRAKALINYIIENRPEYNLKMENFEIHNGEENWAGLKRVLEESNLNEKEEVIAIINRTDLTGQEKKKEIKSLNEGQVWKKMLKEIYPKLRCARYLAVYYDSTDDEKGKIIREANEKINKGEYTDAYEDLQEVKDNERAFNSIGVSLMMQGKFEKAMPWFEKAMKNGCKAAEKNIEAINDEYAYEAQQQKIIEEYLKKYE